MIALDDYADTTIPVKKQAFPWVGFITLVVILLIILGILAAVHSDPLPNNTVIHVKDLSLPQGDKPISLRIDNQYCVQLWQSPFAATNAFTVYPCVKGVYYEPLWVLLRQHLGQEHNNTFSAAGYTLNISNEG